MRSDGIQLWNHAPRDRVHAAKGAVTLCGALMQDGTDADGSFALKWTPVADTIKVGCAGCAAALREVNNAGSR